MHINKRYKNNSTISIRFNIMDNLTIFFLDFSESIKDVPFTPSESDVPFPFSQNDVTLASKENGASSVTEENNVSLATKESGALLTLSDNDVSSAVKENDVLLATKESGALLTLSDNDVSSVTKENDVFIDTKENDVPLVPSKNGEQTFEAFVNLVTLPSAFWKWDVENRTCQLMTYTAERITQKLIKIVDSNEVEFYVNCKLVKPKNFKHSFDSPKDLGDIISEFHSAKICEGIMDLSLLTFYDIPYEQILRKWELNGSLHCNKCIYVGFSGSTTCTKCDNEMKRLKRLKYSCHQKREQKIQTFKKKVKTARKTAQRLYSRTKVHLIFCLNQYRIKQNLHPICN